MTSNTIFWMQEKIKTKCFFCWKQQAMCLIIVQVFFVSIFGSSSSDQVFFVDLVDFWMEFRSIFFYESSVAQCRAQSET